MPPRELVWTPGAVKQLAEFLKRRTDRTGVRNCIEQHLFVAANDLEGVARKWIGPVDDVWIHRFRCEDHKEGKIIALNIQAELDATNGTVGVLACRTMVL